MIKKTITYTDFNEIERTEDFYFNLTRAELSEMQLGKHGVGGMQAYLLRIKEAEDVATMIVVIREMINKSYGVKSEDGKSFHKSKEITTAFETHAAYDVLFMSFFENAQSIADFFKGLMPAGMQAQANAVDNMTPSERARANSEAQMQGRRAAEVKEAPSFVKQPELPTEHLDTTVAPEINVVMDKQSALHGLSNEEIQAMAVRQLTQNNGVQSNLQ